MSCSARCGWASLFGIVDAEVHSEVCPLFFGLGQADALAWQRFDAATRERASQRYLASIAPWRQGERYRIPAEFVIVAAMA